MPKKTLKGTVISNKMQKTVVVEVKRWVSHPKYKKRYKRTKRYKVHNEGNKYKPGDIVLIEETRPISRGKRWRVIKKLK